MSRRDDEIGGRILPHILPGSDVLDLGSGTGRLMRWVTSRIVIQPTLADVVEFGNRVGGFPYVRVRDRLHPPFEDRSFDAVLLLFVLHHIEDWEEQVGLLRHAVRITRKRLILIEDTPLTRLDRVFNTGWDWALNLRHGVPKPFSFRTVEGWRQVFRGLGLTERAVETYRPLWPTLRTYRHTLFVLDRPD